MSTAPSPGSGDTNSLSIIQHLLERNLTDRATALAESRWPGAGQVVQLASEWTTLAPPQRRERLAAIGPEELARLRGVAALQPDLARVLDELEERGVIPPTPIAAVRPSTPDDPQSAPPSARVVPEPLYTLDNIGGPEGEARRRIDQPVAPPEITGDVTSPKQGTTRDSLSDPLIERIDLSNPVVIFNPGATQAFVDGAIERRQAAADRGQATLDRIMATAQQLTDRAAATTTTWPALAQWDKQIAGSGDPQTRREQRGSSRADSVVQTVMPLATRLMSTPLLILDDDEYGADAFAATARDLGLPLFDLWPERDGRRAFFGGLSRRGRSFVTEVGAFPKALSGPALVVVHGGLYSTMIERLLDGFCDIPGTRSTTRVHPDARIVVVPAG